MFQETKRHFIQENGVANGDTTRRTEVFTEYQKATSIDKRLNGTWTLGQYERNYRQAFYDALKKAAPNWEIGKPFDSSILDKISREDIDNSLVKAAGEYGGTNLVSKGIDISVWIKEGIIFKIFVIDVIVWRINLYRIMVKLRKIYGFMIGVIAKNNDTWNKQ